MKNLKAQADLRAQIINKLIVLQSLEMSTYRNIISTRWPRNMTICVIRLITWKLLMYLRSQIRCTFECTMYNGIEKNNNDPDKAIPGKCFLVLFLLI